MTFVMEYGGGGYSDCRKTSFIGTGGKNIRAANQPAVRNQYRIGLRGRMDLDRMPRCDSGGDKEWLDLAAPISTRKLRNVLMLTITSVQNETLAQARYRCRRLNNRRSSYPAVGIKIARLSPTLRSILDPCLYPGHANAENSFRRRGLTPRGLCSSLAAGARLQRGAGQSGSMDYQYCAQPGNRQNTFYA